MLAQIFAFAVMGAAGLFGGIFWENYLKEILFAVGGIGRALQPISEFPYSCRRLQDEGLEACEDMWLDNGERRLYLACSGSLSSQAWNPGGNKFDYANRRATGSVISVLDIDEPGQDGLFDLRQLELVGFTGTNGDGLLNTVGFDMEPKNKDSSKLSLYVVNQRPPVDSDGSHLNAFRSGANGTIEIFDIDRKESKQLVHVKTIVSEAVQTPNGPALTGDGGFFVTNDKSVKQGFRKLFDLWLGGGSIAYCSSTFECSIASSTGHAFPNGMVKGHDGLFYVPNTLRNKIQVMGFDTAQKKLVELGRIRVGMPIENLSVDKNGDIWVAGMPKANKFTASMSDPLNIFPPATVFKIHKLPSGGYDILKVLEDKTGEVVAGATTVVHDVKTGRIFVSGAFTPFISVCDPN
ncbi:hypothetical protein MMC25_001581 [Agyrium rufum]|nr:hypothetical protein [Agyrium rufum]